VRTVDVLHELQAIDSQLDAARTSLVQLQREIGDRSALEPINQQIADLRGQLHTIETEQRDLELNADGRRTKIAADDTKLYSGRVTNPKELDSLSQEIQQEKHQLSIVEDRLLELLDASESLNKRIVDLETALARETEAWNGKQSQASRRVQELVSTVNALDGERRELVSALEAPIRVTYDNLRRQKGGTAVAEVRQQTCLACRVSSLTPALEQRARIGDQIVTCPSCGRIVYVSLK
jgi:uncharacterized protein